MHNPVFWAQAWFVLLSAMLAAYAVLDGYDLGVGALHPWVAKTAEERRICVNAIGPVWNGNEVWLIAAGGMMLVAFPRVYASGFSGFYLALMAVLWLLLMRGIAIEFRSHFAHHMWRGFWDVTFGLASIFLALFLGVALGNIVRGLPIAPNGYFQGSFTLLLNPYSLLTGLLSLTLLVWHGANYLRRKAVGTLEERARQWAAGLWWAALALIAGMTAATLALRAGIGANFLRQPLALILPAVTVAGLGLGFWSRRRGRQVAAFRASTMVIVGLLGSAAASVYPALLPSTLDRHDSLTIFNAASTPHALFTSFLANIVGMIAVAFYSYHVHRTFAGKVHLPAPGTGHEY